MKLKTLNAKGQVCLKEYPDSKIRQIFAERYEYVLECLHNYGEDYGGNQCSEESETTYQEIVPERILVKDGHFCGVALLIDYDYYNGGGCETFEETLLFTDGTQKGNNRDGYSFSNDDHDRWDYTDYYLVKRPDEKAQ